MRSRSEEEVTPKTDAGRTIVLQIEKLSAEEQEFLSSIEAKVENPFKRRGVARPVRGFGDGLRVATAS